jgi:antitoxin component of MazEF toxin-antitoxin module
MPIIRKIVQVGKAKAVCLPKAWLEWIKREYGETPNEVEIEVDHVLKIKPLLSKEV